MVFVAVRYAGHIGTVCPSEAGVESNYCRIMRNFTVGSPRTLQFFETYFHPPVTVNLGLLTLMLQSLPGNPT